MNADWNATSGDAQILNEPTIPSIAGLATTSYVDSQDATKQDVLVSGTNIKTINGTTVLGSGDITISGGSGVTDVTATSPISSTGGTTPDISITQASAADDGYLSTGDWNMFNNKQDALSSGVNIKTINYSSLLGSGNIDAVSFFTPNSPINGYIGFNGNLNVGIDQSNSTTDGYLNSTDWNTFNGKQASLVSGTNIKTINSTSVLGSGNLAVQPTLVSGTNIKTINGNSVLGSGDLTISGGGLQGVYNIIRGQSGNVINNRFFGTSTNFATYTNNIIKLHPYISNYTYTTSSIGIQILTPQTGANTRILIYSDSLSKPNTKLYESATIDCSTGGIKTAITSFTFTAGVVYWIGFQNSFTTTSASISSLTSSNLPPFRGDATANAAYIGYQTSAYSLGSAPTTMGAVTLDNTNYILLWLTIA